MLPEGINAINLGKIASTIVRVGGAEPYSRGTRTTKARTYGNGTSVAIAARHRDNRPIKVGFGGETDGTTTGGHAQESGT